MASIVVDDYSRLRDVTTETLAASATLYPVKNATSYARRGTFGSTGRGSQGEALYGASNPEYGAVITYSLKEPVFTSRKDKRVEAQRAAEKAGKPITYPTPQDFIAEADEEPVVIGVSLVDAAGKVWRVLTAPGAKGVGRVVWDLRGALDAPGDAVVAPGAVGGGGGGGCGGGGAGGGLGGGGAFSPVPPGTYTATLVRRENGVSTPMAAPVTFSVLHDPAATTTVADREANSNFRAQSTKLSRQLSSAIEAANSAKTKIDAIIRVLDQMPQAPVALAQRARSINQRLVASLRALRGGNVNSARGEQVPVSIQAHAGNATPGGMLAPPTSTNREQYEIALAEFTAEYAKLKPILTTELPELEQERTRIGAPPTPGRLPPES